ncbi:MAG: lytic murein transglycosylase [Sphingomonadales bacterium]
MESWDKRLSQKLRRWLVALALVCGLATAASAQDQNFDAWLAALADEARAAGISERIIDQALGGIQPISRVVELDRRQPEFTVTFRDYIKQRLSDTRIRRGVQQWTTHNDDLARVAKAYGVDASVILAIWGLETNYGSYVGGFDVIPALATLAYDARRSAYFRRELLAALQILERGDIAVAAMKGSWAGAMGQSQFMPSSFLAYAQDFDEDGRRDIWTTPVDVFASIAHYLKRHGWRDDMIWGRPVALPDDFGARREIVFNGETPEGCRRAMQHHSREMPVPEWDAFGIRRTNGDTLPPRQITASLVVTDDGAGPAYLTYQNYHAILRYNCSNHYALSVGLLADRLKRERARQNQP